MLELLRFLGLAALLLGFGVAAAVGGVAELRGDDTGAGVVLLLLAALFLLGLAGHVHELLDRRRPPRTPPAPAPRAAGLPAGTPSNQGDTPDAFFVTRHGSATGYHFTDKLTPDGVLAGYRHDDFAPGFVQTYGVRVPPELVARVFDRVRSPEYAALPDRIEDPRIHDGHVLRIVARTAGKDRVIWLSNTTDPLLTPLIEALHAARPPGPHG